MIFDCRVVGCWVHRSLQHLMLLKLLIWQRQQLGASIVRATPCRRSYFWALSDREVLCLMFCTFRVSSSLCLQIGIVMLIQLVVPMSQSLVVSTKVDCPSCVDAAFVLTEEVPPTEGDYICRRRRASQRKIIVCQISVGNTWYRCFFTNPY